MPETKGERAHTKIWHHSLDRVNIGLLLSDITLPWTAEICSYGGKQWRGCPALTYHPRAWLLAVRQVCAASVWATGSGWSRAEAPVEGCLLGRAVPRRSEEAPLSWAPREAQWMGAEGRMGTLGPECKEALWGCRDGTCGAAATRTAARQCSTQSRPDLVWGGSGSCDPGRTCTRQVDRVGGFDEEFLARSGRRP